MTYWRSISDVNKMDGESNESLYGRSGGGDNIYHRWFGRLERKSYNTLTGTISSCIASAGCTT